MNSKQSEAVRRKRHVIAQNLQLDAATCDLFLKKKLITKSMINDLKDEKSSYSKTLKYIDLLEGKSNGLGKGVNDRLFSYLGQSYPHVLDELTAELKSLQGEIKIENYIRSEARCLVHREFDTTVRLTEDEKNDMAELVAMRMQISKEMWMKRIEANKEKLSSIENSTLENETLQRDLLRSTSDFVYENRGRVSGGVESIGPKNTINVDKIHHTELSSNLISSSNDLMELASRSFQERKECVEGKAAILRVLSANGSSNVDIGDLVETRFDQLDKQLSNWDNKLKEKRNHNDTLQHQLKTLKKNLETRQMNRSESMQAAEESLNDAQKYAENLKEREIQLKEEVKEAKALAAKQRSQFAVMSNTRRLGYVDNTILNEVSRKEATVLPKVDQTTSLVAKRKSR